MARIIEMTYEGHLARATRQVAAFNKVHGCCIPAPMRPLTDAIEVAYCACKPDERETAIRALIRVLDYFNPTDVVQQRVAVAARRACDFACFHPWGPRMSE